MFIKRGDGKVLSIVEPEDLENVDNENVEKVATDKLKQQVKTSQQQTKVDKKAN